MSDNTTHLGLPYVANKQAQRHIFHDEGLRILDALVMLSVADRDLSAPPASPAEGDRYIVKAPGSGAFAGKDNRIAHYADGAWFFYVASRGWLCYVADESALLSWDGSAWQPALSVVSGLTSLQNLSLLGIGTTADAVNPVSGKLNNTLWTAKTVAEGGDGNLRYKLSKENAAKTLSLLLQDNFSGRAELGLTGDDDLHVKVSPDGSAWYEAIVIDRNTGGVRFAAAEVDVASAATSDIGAAAARRVRITGTTTVTSFGTAANCERLVRLAGALTLTHNATSLVLPGAGNIVGGGGDTFMAVSDASGNWRAMSYVRADGHPLTTGNASIASASTTDLGSTLAGAMTVTGTTTVTSFGSTAPTGAKKFISFSGALTLTHNATSLILLTGASRTTAAGDCGVYRHEGSGNWREVSFSRAGAPAAPFDALAFNGMQVDGSGDVSQVNGTAQLTLASNTETYLTDTWLAAYQNTGAVVKARQLSSGSFPGGLPGYGNAVELKATTALSSLANGDYAKHIAVIEGYRVACLGWGGAGAQALSYAFQYYSPRSATIFVKLSNNDRSRCYYDEKAVVAGWNFVAGTLAGDTSGTWQTTTSIGLRIEVFSAGKAASPATAGSWGVTNTTATTNSTQNNLSSTNDAALVTGLIVLPGIELPPSSRAPLVMRPFAQELDACRRYFEKSYDYAVAPGTASVGAGVIVKTIPNNIVASTQGYGNVSFKALSRTASPTITVYGYSGGSGKISDNGGVDLAANSGSTQFVGQNGFHPYNNSGGSITTGGNVVLFHWTKSDRL